VNTDDFPKLSHRHAEIFPRKNVFRSVSIAVARVRRTPAQGERRPRLALSFTRKLETGSSGCLKFAHIDLLDPDARTPLLLGRGGWSHQP